MVRGVAEAAGAQPVPAGGAGHAVHVDRLHGPELEVTLEDLLGEPESVRPGLQQLVALARGPEEDVLVTELLLEKVSELAQPDLVGEEAVEVLGPASGPSRCLKILLNINVVQILLAVERQSVQALGVRNTDFNVILEN